VEADSLATDFSAALTNPLPEIPFNPTTKIQLIIGRNTVTSHIRSRIRYQMHRHLLAGDLIRQRYKWTWAVFRSVDFKSGGLIYRSAYDHRSSIVKFIHEKLLTGSRLSHRESDIYEAWCYRCGAAHENSLHILLCPSETGQQGGGTPYTALFERPTPRLYPPICMIYQLSFLL
jgi:hypothetical protein